MFRGFLLLIFISLSIGNVNGQQRRIPASIISSGTSTGNFYHATGHDHEAARAIEFNEQTVTASEFLDNINDYFDIPAIFSFIEAESSRDHLGMQHHLMQQYYGGLPIEGLGYRVHEKNGFVTSANGKAVRDINININTTLSEEQAFNRAVMHLQTQDTTFRSGKKLIVSKDYTFTPESFAVAYQFDIEVSIAERWRISIDAHDGQVINKESLVKSCLVSPPPEFSTGTGTTNYYGNKTIRVEKLETGYSRLVGETEHGGKIGTYDFKNVSILALFFGFYNVYHFYSSDNSFDSHYEQPAVSVQWAAEQAYEYYFTKHNRNSFDNNGAAITSYVHIDKNMDNAFWTGEILGFGDGSNNNPLVELDVVSHELTHGVNQYEANLLYSYEPGALNESFSDILAKAVEFSTLGDMATWQLAKYFREGGLRDMTNPNLKGQPDTYLGDMWHSTREDYGGVHTNSGVQNIWFYLLCEGGSGVNDYGENYTVNSIGMDTAVNIVYRNLTEYLISSSDYLDSRIGSLLAAADLYGKNSLAYQEVEKAWDAVGVIDEPIITSLNLYDVTGTTVKVKGSLLPRGDTVTYHFEYGTTPEYEDSTSIYEYTDKVEGIITGLQSETTYYLKLVATNENGSTMTTTEFTTLSLAPLVRVKNKLEVTDTSATFYGQVNPNSLPTSFYFEYGPTPEMGLVSSSYSLPDTTEFLNISASVVDLQPRQTYFYKLVATNDFSPSATDSLTFFTAVKPVISSFSPVAANVGTEITITGENFSLKPEKNLINFGATRGTVLSSSSTEIKVKVPAGASLGQISLLDAESGLTAESAQEFVPTFTGEFGKDNLQLRAAFDDLIIWNTAVQDMDSDARPDIVTTHYYGITIFQNGNTGGDITNESFIQSSIPIISFSYLTLVDFDGNGLKDIVGVYNGGVRVYPNFSVPGFIFFKDPIDIPLYASSMQFGDFDNDGRIDIAGYKAVSTDSTLLTIYRNQSLKFSPDSFEQPYEKVLPYSYIRYFNNEDLNNDGKLDFIVSNIGESYFSIIKNISTPGNFDFELSNVQDPHRMRLTNYISQDLNQDGWKDLASFSTMSIDTTKVTILQSKGPDISFLKPAVVLDGHNEESLQPGDLNGDGKVDLLIGDDDGKFIFLKNETEAGEHISDSSFVLFEHYGINNTGREVESNIILNDLNGDGRPEVINKLDYFHYPNEGHQLEIWQNAPNDCPDPFLIDVNAERNSATLVLPDSSSLEDFEIQYKATSSYYWWHVSSTTLENLSQGTSYQLKARAKCYLGYTSYYYINFTTECVDLSSFSISQISETDVWLSAINLSNFEVQFTDAGNDNWELMPQNAQQINDLLPGTTYDLRYRGRCYSSTEFNYTQFTTLCPMLSTVEIDYLTFNKAVVNWTSNYDGEAVIEYSADNISWNVLDETLTMYSLIPGKEYFLRGRFKCTDVDSDYIYTSFTTPCPEISKFRTDNITPFSAEISWEDESETGSYTVIYSTTSGEMITMTTNSTSLYLDNLYPGTQYTISVAPECISEKDFTSLSFYSVCYVPFNMSADDITYTTAEISWEDNFSGIPYSVEYSALGSGDWYTIETESKETSLEGLRPATSYEARVQITCLDVTAQYAFVRFATSAYEETMIAPNPTQNIITIYPSKNLIEDHYEIFDNKGRKVADGTLHDYTFDFSIYPAGIYFIKIGQEKLLKIVRN